MTDEFKITNIKTLFTHFADADNDTGWYMYEKSFKKAIKRRDKEIIKFLKWHTGLPISTEMLDELRRKLNEC